jgi:hypothetical protein
MFKRNNILSFAWRDLGEPCKPQSGHPVSQPRLEPSTSRLKVWIVDPKPAGSVLCNGRFITLKLMKHSFIHASCLYL